MTYWQEVRLQLDGPGQIGQSGLRSSHGQEHSSPLIVGQVVLRVSLWENIMGTNLQQGQM